MNECRKETKVSRIKVEENGKKAVILNLEKLTYVVSAVDGCMIKNSVSADCAVSREGVGDVFIELKGADVNHAAEQIVATATFWTTHNLSFGRLAGLVVACRYPKVSTAIQRAKVEFAKKFKGPLHVVNRNAEYEFDKLLSFTGPL